VETESKHPAGPIPTNLSTRKPNVRILLLILVLSNWMQAMTLTVNSAFATNEDVVLVFSYNDLLAKCTVSSAPTGFRISSISSNGTLEIATSTSGPWSVPTINTTIFLAGQYLRFTPLANANGSGANMFSMQATDGSTYSLERSVTVDIAAVNDVITASSGTFVQPASPQVTEDIQYTFTWQQITDTLSITEPDPQDWTISLTSKLSGTLFTAGGTVITTFPTDLPVGLLSANALRWTPDPYAFTKPGEAPIAAFTAKAKNVPLGDQSAEVTFSTPVVGVNTVLGVPTTLTSMDPLPVDLVTPIELTYDDVRNRMHGCNDYDRTGNIFVNFTDPALSGMIVRRFTWSGNTITTTQDFAVPATTISMDSNTTISIIAFPSLTRGLHTAGTIAIWAHDSPERSSMINFSISVPTITDGTAGTTTPSGGGGACGAGQAGLCLFMVLILNLCMRRRQS